MIKLSKEKPYEDACKILGLCPVANYKSYKLTDETRNFIKLETVAKALNEGWKPTTIDPKEVRYYVWVGTIQIIENLPVCSMLIQAMGLALLLLLSVIPWNSKTRIQQKNLQEYVNL